MVTQNHRTLYFIVFYWVSLRFTEGDEKKWYDCPAVYPYGIVYYRFDGRHSEIRFHPVPRITSMQGDPFLSLVAFSRSKTSCRFVSLSWRNFIVKWSILSNFLWLNPFYPALYWDLFLSRWLDYLYPPISSIDVVIV